MSQNLNTTEKKLKFSCSTCQTNWQLLVIRTDCLTNKNTKCLNQCQDKWQSLLINYCQEQIILDFTKQEQQKDERQSLVGDQKQQDLANWLKQIKKNDKE